jgi:hypothetical protein
MSKDTRDKTHSPPLSVKQNLMSGVGHIVHSSRYMRAIGTPLGRRKSCPTTGKGHELEEQDTASCIQWWPRRYGSLQKRPGQKSVWIGGQPVNSSCVDSLRQQPSGRQLTRPNAQRPTPRSFLTNYHTRTCTRDYLGLSEKPFLSPCPTQNLAQIRGPTLAELGYCTVKGTSSRFMSSVFPDTVVHLSNRWSGTCFFKRLMKSPRGVQLRELITSPSYSTRTNRFRCLSFQTLMMSVRLSVASVRVLTSMTISDPSRGQRKGNIPRPAARRTTDVSWAT